MILPYACGVTENRTSGRTTTRRLAEVAKKVGVSEATVSRVLNGKPGVSEATRAAVLTALDVLGYERPTKLRGERARLVGLVLPELQNPIFPAFAEVVGGALAQRGFTPVLCTRTAGGVSEADYIEMLLEQQVSGVVFAGGHYAAGRRAARALPPAAGARPAGRAGQRGHRGPRLPAGVHRRRGARWSRRTATWSRSATSGSAWCSARRTTCRPAASSTRSSPRPAAPGCPPSRTRSSAPCSRWRAAQAAATRLVTARRHRHHLRQRRARARRDPGGAPRSAWRCPSDVSVVGFDDSAFMNCTDPPLTTVRQPIEAMGRTAVTLLVNQIDGASVTAEELLFEPELVVRGSTGPARARVPA